MSNGWTKFPNYLIDQIATFKETELKVLLFFLLSLNQNRCCISQRRISAGVKKGRLTINRAIQCLKEKGIIQNERFPGRIPSSRIEWKASEGRERNPVTVKEALALKEKSPYQYRRGEAVKDFALCPNCQKIFWIFTGR